MSVRTLQVSRRLSEPTCRTHLSWRGSSRFQILPVLFRLHPIRSISLVPRGFVLLRQRAEQSLNNGWHLLSSQPLDTCCREALVVPIVLNLRYVLRCLPPCNDSRAFRINHHCRVAQGPPSRQQGGSDKNKILVNPFGQ